MSPSGGKRPGAGRKPAGSGPKRQVAYRLSPEIVAYLGTLPNQSAALEAAVRATAGFAAWQQARETSRGP